LLNFHKEILSTNRQNIISKGFLLNKKIIRLLSGITILLVFITGCSSFSSYSDQLSSSQLNTTANQHANNAGQKQRYIVSFQPGLAQSKNERIISQNNGTTIRELNYHPNTLIITIPEQALKGLANNPNIISIRPDIETNATKGKPSKPSKPTSPSQSLPWGIDRIDSDQSWNITKGAGINVAIIDSGIDANHPDLEQNIKGGINFVVQRGKVNPNKWNDDNGHGSHVAGIVAAVDNEIGVVGVAPQANLWAIKALDRRGSGYLSDLIDSIDWSINTHLDTNQDNNIHVINMSLSFSESYGESDFPLLSSAINTAKNAGIIIIAAAGNSGINVAYPASDDDVIAVSAIDNNDQITSWSNRGSEIQFAAPGSSIYSSYKDGEYNTLSGTSMAAPHVAGVAALMLAAQKTTLLSENIGLSSDLQGNGLIDAEATVNQ
jgi:subtilisin